jgi:hypothetical protein
MFAVPPLPTTRLVVRPLQTINLAEVYTLLDAVPG